ncbi:xanthine dehydrogenase family protein subunit M [bacterium]|nr:xanthine dehydrogenase family protein subunit M [bacterium]
MKDFKIYSPTTLDEALEIKAKYLNNILILAGGTDIVGHLKDKLVKPKALLSLSKIIELNYIEQDENKIMIGPSITHSEAVGSEVLNRYAGILVEGCKVLGSPQIRNIATIGGNVVNASPVADTVPPLCVLGANLTLRSIKRERKVPIENFAICPGKSVIEDDEILTQISFTKMENNDKGFYKKTGQRRAMSIAKASVALKASVQSDKLSDVRVVLGAVAPKVILAMKTAAFLEGKKLDNDIAQQAARIVESEAAPITDLRSNIDYRKMIVGVILERGLLGLR